MALAHNPKVATNGLVLYYDMDNTVKSFKGKPTTNIRASVGLGEGDYASSGRTIDNSFSLTAPDGSTGWSSISSPGSDSNYRIAKFAYNTLSEGSTYTFSLELYNPGPNSLEIFIDGNIGQSGTTIPLGYSRWSFPYTVTRTGGGNWAVFFGAENKVANATYSPERLIYFKNYQVEEGGFATPFTEGTRSNTEAILDISKGNHTITATNVSYNADGTFEFDGTDDYIDLPSNLGYTTQVSPFAWFKSSGTPAGNYHIIMGGAQLEISIYTSGYLRVGLNQGGSRFVSNHGSGLLDGNWHYIGFTFDGSTKTAYIDGEPVGTQSVSSGLLATTFTRRIGRFGGDGTYYANGQIGAVQIYNRSLTSDEVKNNYNTLRRRYGV